MQSSNHFPVFFKGAARLMPLAVGVIPFGMIMGTLESQYAMTLFESFGLNLIVFAGASQLVAIELLNNDMPVFMVVLTGLVINLRLIMYSTSLAPHMTNLSPARKIGMAYLITDQAYAIAIAEFENLSSWKDRILFYMGAGVSLFLLWQVSVVIGFYFGNLAPESWSLDFAVPLAFLSLVVPAIKDSVHGIVALTSAILSVIFYSLPMNMGLLLASIIALTVGAIIHGKRRVQ